MASAQSNSGPVRLVRFSVVQGGVEWRPDTTTSWAAASVNLPIREGAQIWAPTGARAELMFDDGTFVRLAPDSTLVLQNLYSDKNGEFTDMKLSVGHAYLRAPHAYSIYQFDTPDASIKVDGPTRCRVDSGSNVRLAMYSGQASVENDSGTTTVGSHQCAEIGGAADPLSLVSLPAPDSWDEWNSSRDAVCFRTDPYVPRNIGLVSGELTNYGHWHSDPQYGHVWAPDEPAGWQPYYHGSWDYNGPYGWTWVGEEPWGWAPYHYGSWVHRGFGWAWYPGPAMQYWSPAVVDFSWSNGNVCWAPLAPAECSYPAAFSIGFGSGNWSLFFSIGGAAVWDPGSDGRCYSHPWVSAYLNQPFGWGGAQAFYRGYNYAPSHFVPYNARFGGAVTASADGFRGGRGFQRMASARGAAAFRNGRALSFGRGQAPLSGPAGAAPDARSFTASRRLTSRAPSAAVMNRRVVAASANSFASARRYTASRSTSRGSFNRAGATANRPGAAGFTRGAATRAGANSRWNPNARVNSATAAAAARRSLNYNGRTGAVNRSGAGARAQSFTRANGGSAAAAAANRAAANRSFERATANRAAAAHSNRAAMNRATTNYRANANRAAAAHSNRAAMNRATANHRANVNRAAANRNASHARAAGTNRAPARRSMPANRPAPRQMRAANRPAPRRGGGGAPQRMAPAPRNPGGGNRGGGGAPRNFGGGGNRGGGAPRNVGAGNRGGGAPRNAGGNRGGGNNRRRGGG